MRILFLSRWFPYPANNGSKLRISNLLQGLAHQHEITLLSFADDTQTVRAVDDPTGFCVQVWAVPWRSYNPSGYQARLGILSPRPRFIVDTFSPEMAHQITIQLQAQEYDVVIASQIDMAAYRPYFQNLPALFEEIEISTLYEQYTQANSLAARLRYGLTWFKYRHYLRSSLQNFQGSTVASVQERELVTQNVTASAKLSVIPNCIDLVRYAKTEDGRRPHTLIFTGSFRYAPNYEAVCWFLREVYPLVQAQIPDVQLYITGDHANKPLPTMQNVTLTGHVADIQVMIASCAVSIAPVHTGGGTRLKILEAMALHSPVVATTKGAEGLAARSGEHLLLADTPAAFASAVSDLLEEPALCHRLTTNAYQLVAQHYSLETVGPRFVKLVEQVANQGKKHESLSCDCQLEHTALPSRMSNIT